MANYNPSKILIICKQEITGVEYHRLMMPAHRLSEQGFDISVINSIDANTLDDKTPMIDFLKQFETVICNRTISHYGNTQRALNNVKRAGCKLVVDVDDYWELPGYHLLYRDFYNGKFADQAILCLRSADLVTASTPILAQKVKPFNRNVEVLENAIDPNQPQWEINKVESERVRFGWVGGICHFPDLLILENSIGKCYSDSDLINKMQIVYGGFSLDQMVIVGEEKKRLPIPMQECYKFERIFTNHYRGTDEEYGTYLNKFIRAPYFTDNVPYKRIWASDVFNYGFMYDQIDVALIPLKNDSFNSCKSELKMIEAGFKKIPCIVSEVEPYTLLINKENALTVTPRRDHKDWYKHIKKFTESETMRNDYAEALYESVKVKYHIDTVNEKRKELWSNTVSV